MEKRVKLKCWHCHREYSLLRNLKGKPKLLVACPFCEREGVADLSPYRSEVVEIYQSDTSAAQSVGETLDLPEVLPTTEPEE